MYRGFNIICLFVTVSQTPYIMGHILYLVPVWALATAWLYFLSHLAPALDVDHEVSEMVIVVDWKLQRHSLESQNFVCDYVYNFFLILFVINHITFLWRTGSHIDKDVFCCTAVSIVTKCLKFHRKRHWKITSPDFVTLYYSSKVQFLMTAVSAITLIQHILHVFAILLMHWQTVKLRLSIYQKSAYYSSINVYNRLLDAIAELVTNKKFFSRQLKKISNWQTLLFIGGIYGFMTNTW